MVSARHGSEHFSPRRRPTARLEQTLPLSTFLQPLNILVDH